MENASNHQDLYVTKISTFLKLLSTNTSKLGFMLFSCQRKFQILTKLDAFPWKKSIFYA